MRALSIAATGMAAQQVQLEVVANNIANSNTTGFKRARAEFTDLIYQSGMPANLAGRAPEGVQIGLGVTSAAVRQVFLQGAVQQTSNPLDVAVTGSGWFAVEGPDGERLFTRSGAFNTNADGDLVTINGLRLADGINVPDGARDLSISEEGVVTVRIAGDANAVEIGRLSLHTFINPNGLEALGGNLFRPTDLSGPALAGDPGADGFGTLKQGFLEQSNVDPIREITDMIAAQRAYEMNSKVIKAADDMSAVVSQGIR